ncbi:MAG: DUF4276 family protein [Anaerolineaceae bacterium]|nr:DUF4276 family protein [Anaerolineaceae bacterium]
MTDVYIICEGPTEVRFVKYVLAPSFGNQRLFLYPVTIGSQRSKGGNVTFDRLYINVRRQLYNNRQSYCSTLVDYYGLDSKFPGLELASTKSNLSAKADAVADSLVGALSRTIDRDPLLRFIPYVQMHEFEALMFSDPATLADAIRRPALRKDFAEIRQKFETPEHIDNSPFTAPSKRILALYPEYEKPLMGETAAKAIGLPKIRQECPLFDDWLARLESLPPLPA